MKNEHTEKQIKEKLDSLSDMPPGLSFDRSAAWDKLQYRLEKTPQKTGRYLYYWAAAALLLFLLSIVIENRRQEKTIVKKMDGTSTQIPDKQAEIKTQALSVYAKSKRGDDIRVVKPVLSKGRKNVLTPGLNKNDRPSGNVYVEYSKTDPVQKPDSILKPPVQMPLAIKSKLKVVHINDLVDDENQADMIRRENRMVSGGFHFLDHPNDRLNNTDEHYIPQNHFKILSNQ